MSQQMEVCVMPQAQYWSLILEKDTLGAWTSPPVEKCIGQTPSPFPTTSGTKPTSPTLYQKVTSTLHSANKNTHMDEKASY